MDELLDGKQSLRDFLAGYGIELRDVPMELADALSRSDLSYNSIWAWCQLGTLFGRSLKATPIVCLLLARDDHEGHEDLADTLQDLRDPRSVQCLSDRANRRLPYLDFNESSALARRCAWALHDIGTSEAIAELNALTRDPREEVSREAADRLEALGARRGATEQASYRKARDAGLGGL